MAAEDKDLHQDPLTGEPGSHPVGTGIGAAGGAVAGAAAGVVGGPVGMAVGGVVGAVIGGLAGHAAAEAMDPTAEEAHWRENYEREPYYEQGRSFDDYAPAYRLGMTGRTRYEDWDSAEPQLRSEWDSTRGQSDLDWDRARPASRAAWDRVDTNMRSRVSGDDSIGGTRMGDTSMADTGMRDTRMGDTAMSDTRVSDTGMQQRMDSGMQSQSMGGQYQSMGSSYTGTNYSDSGRSGTGAAGAVGSMQSAGNDSGDRDDVIDVLQDLAECSMDGEYGFRECADRAKREDLKSLFLQRADDCRRAVQELNEQIRGMGGKIEEHGSTAGAIHRGWVSVKSAMSTYDDKAVLEECERGEDNAMSRYRKALKAQLPANIKLIVERQMQGVQRNHDQIKMLRDQFRAQS